MKTAELLESRRANWQELERICNEMAGVGKKKRNARRIGRFAALYRATCADLALADSYQLPPRTVHYLHQLVARAHNQLYRSRRFDLATWGHEMFVAVPQRLFNDRCLQLSFVIFWTMFLIGMYLASDYGPNRKFAAAMVPPEMAQALGEMYKNPIGSEEGAHGFESFAAGRYVYHNASIGLMCFAMGLLFGIGGMFTLAFNAAFLGAVFGYMSTLKPHSDHFFEFVTAHGPFELTAIVLSAAAGMRLGFALVDTGGLSRFDSLRKTAWEAMPVAGAAVVLFVLAAIIEGFISPSSLPYEVKGFVAAMSCAALLVYFVVLGYPRTDGVGTR